MVVLYFNIVARYIICYNVSTLKTDRLIAVAMHIVNVIGSIA